jgi:hypothetical protein
VATSATWPFQEIRQVADAWCRHPAERDIVVDADRRLGQPVNPLITRASRLLLTAAYDHRRQCDRLRNSVQVPVEYRRRLSRSRLPPKV